MEEQQTQTEHTSHTVRKSDMAKSSGKRPHLLVIVVAGIIVICGLLWFFVFNGDGIALLQRDTADEGVVVAIVNGENVFERQITDNRARAEQVVLQQGISPESPEFDGFVQEQALNVAINTVLLVQAAEAADISVTDEEVDSQISLLETQLGGEEAFDAQAASLGLSNEDIRDNVNEQLIIDSFVTQSEELTGLSVSNEEISSFYNLLKEQNGEELPPLETLAPQIEQQILLQKQQEAILVLIDRLRGEATIEVLN